MLIYTHIIKEPQYGPWRAATRPYCKKWSVALTVRGREVATVRQPHPARTSQQKGHSPGQVVETLHTIRGKVP